MIYTSYFANKKIPKHLKKVSIARITPKWSKVDEEYKLLAPNKELLYGYKNGTINEMQYEVMYLQQLSTIDIQKLHKDLDGKVLLCYEANEEFCHRHILSNWLNKNNIKAEELDIEKYNVEIEQYIDVPLCNSFPDKIFVFGDNLDEVGKRGQAIIRDCKNSFGIPTKRHPRMDEDSFFSDKDDEMDIVLEKLRQLYKLMIGGKTIVFPKDGIGTGLAKMQEKSPKIYNKMNEIIDMYFMSYVKEKKQKTLF